MATKKAAKPTEGWIAPPPASVGRPPRPGSTEIAERLRAHPGEWDRVATGEKSNYFATTINKGAGAFTEGRWEATSRQAEDGIDIYARFIGE